MMKTNRFKLLALTTCAMPLVYNSSGNGWKTDDDGNLVLKDGNPVYVDMQGAEKTVEAGTISRLNAEAKTNRESVERLTIELKAFEGIDPKIARDAITTVGKIDSKTLIDAGKVDEVREQVKAQFVEQMAAKDAENSKLVNTLNGMTLQHAFSQSEFIKTHVATPVSMFTSEFGKNFKVENGKTIPLDASGQPLLSKKRAGETATLDEALEIYVDNHPEKMSILREQPKSGSGNSGNGGNSGDSGNRMSRANFDALSPQEQAVKGRELASGKLVLTD